MSGALASLFLVVYVLGFLSGIGFGLYVLSRLLPLPTHFEGPR